MRRGNPPKVRSNKNQQKPRCVHLPTDDVVDVVLLAWIGGIAEEALLAVLEMRDDAVALGTIEAACRGGVQLLPAPNQQVTCGRVARALLARVHPPRL